MAYISAKDVSAIRSELKAAFPKFRFGVRKQDSMAVSVTVKSGPTDFSDIFEDYNQGRDRKYAQINHYHLGNYGRHTKFFEKILKIIKTAPANGEGYHKGKGWFDESDAQVDYFHTAYYIHLNVGDWNKEYVRTK